ncbi:Uma2 family endonuclease [Paenibacillus chungangensis]|uniref:Uma2 family endonuclease n=1 Tax=Paenibacillus chungangensis TaxID=696535 RepID=A0ABW3HVC4_9BACL
MSSKKEKENVLREQPMTYEDYAAFDDGQRYELVEGKLELMSPCPSAQHQIVSFEMQKHIARTCELEYMVLFAPLDVILDKHEVRQPDLVMIHRSRLHILSKRGVEGIPDLVVEILSPSTLLRDKRDKLIKYAYYQIPEYWIVDPANGALEQYELAGSSYELTEIYTGTMTVQSRRISCISFTMKEIISHIPDHIRE